MYLDRIAPQLDNADIIARPGVFWTRLLDDGSADQLILRPIPQSTGEQLRMIYTSIAPELTDVTDTFDVSNAFEDGIISYGSFLMLMPQDRTMALQWKDHAEDAVTTLIQSYTNAKNRQPRRLADYRRYTMGPNNPFTWWGA